MCDVVRLYSAQRVCAKCNNYTVFSISKVFLPRDLIEFASMKCTCEVASVTSHLFPLWVKLGLKANLRVERWVRVGRLEPFYKMISSKTWVFFHLWDEVNESATPVLFCNSLTAGEVGQEGPFPGLCCSLGPFITSRIDLPFIFPVSSGLSPSSIRLLAPGWPPHCLVQLHLCQEAPRELHPEAGGHRSDPSCAWGSGEY